MDSFSSVQIMRFVLNDSIINGISSVNADVNPDLLCIKNTECLSPKNRNVNINDFSVIPNPARESESNFTLGQTHFSLSCEKWKEFCEVLDSPAKEIPSLKKLLTEPSVFDDECSFSYRKKS